MASPLNMRSRLACARMAPCAPCAGPRRAMIGACQLRCTSWREAWADRPAASPAPTPTRKRLGPCQRRGVTPAAAAASPGGGQDPPDSSGRKKKNQAQSDKGGTPADGTAADAASDAGSPPPQPTPSSTPSKPIKTPRRKSRTPPAPANNTPTTPTYPSFTTPTPLYPSYSIPSPRMGCILRGLQVMDVGPVPIDRGLGDGHRQAAGLGWLAQRLCERYEGLGDTPQEVAHALTMHGIHCAVCIRPSGTQAVVFRRHGGKQLRDEEAVAAELQLQERSSGCYSEPMMWLASQLLEWYVTPEAAGATSHAVAGWLTGLGIKCTVDPQDVLEKLPDVEDVVPGAGARVRYLVPGDPIALFSTHAVALRLGLDRRPLLSARSQAWHLDKGREFVITQLRAHYVDDGGSFLADTAHMSPALAHIELTRQYRVWFNTVRTWDTTGTKIESAWLCREGVPERLTLQQVATHVLGLARRRREAPPMSPEGGMDKLVQHLCRERYVALLPGGACLEVHGEEGWRALLEQRGVECSRVVQQGAGFSAWFTISRERAALPMKPAAAVLGLVPLNQLGSVADNQQRGMYALAQALVDEWEEMGASHMPHEAQQVLQARYGVACLVYRGVSHRLRNEVLGAYFVPAGSDAELQQLRVAGHDGPLPNSVVMGGQVVGRLVCDAGDAARALGLEKQRKLEPAFRELARQLRTEYEWPGVASDDQGVALLRAAGVTPRFVGRGRGTLPVPVEEVVWDIPGVRRGCATAYNVAAALGMEPRASVSASAGQPRARKR